MAKQLQLQLICAYFVGLLNGLQGFCMCLLLGVCVYLLNNFTFSKNSYTFCLSTRY